MATEFDKNWESMQPILTIDAGDSIESSEKWEDVVWHELQNAYHTKRVLSASLGGYEATEGGGVVVAYYKEHRIVIPMKEMALNLVEQKAYGELDKRQIRIVNSMLDCEIDFAIIALDNEERSVVASRRLAMKAKRKKFYFADIDGKPRINVKDTVQARVIAVGEKAIRLDVFGAECSVTAKDLSWEWLGDARERYTVGERILVVVTSIEPDEETLDVKVTAEVKSLLKNNLLEKMKEAKIQGSYAGKITDIHKGVIFIRLDMGVNAIAHSCKDHRMPGKGDRVTFTVTHHDEENAVAVGIINRIIRQNVRGW